MHILHALLFLFCFIIDNYLFITPTKVHRGITVLWFSHNSDSGHSSIVLIPLLSNSKGSNTPSPKRVSRIQDEHSCKLKAIKKQLIERAAVIITVDKVLSKDETIERVADSIVKLQSKEDTTIPALREQLKECEKGIENMPYTPDQFTASSSYSAYWHCDRGHSWRAAIVSRYESSGCPVCCDRKRYHPHFVWLITI